MTYKKKKQQSSSLEEPWPEQLELAEPLAHTGVA